MSEETPPDEQAGTERTPEDVADTGPEGPAPAPAAGQDAAVEPAAAGESAAGGEGPSAGESAAEVAADDEGDEIVPLAVGDVTVEVAAASCLGPGLVPSATVTAQVEHGGGDEPVAFTVNLVFADPDTGADGALISSASGSVTVGETQQLSLRYANPGQYRLEVVVEGEDEPSATAEVQTLLCLVTTSSCDSVTFSNAEGNPALVLDYSDIDSDGRTVQAELAPGTSLTLTDLAVSWSAVSSLDQTVRAGQGFAEPTYAICEPELGSVSSYCTAAGTARGVLDIEAFYPADADVSWRVVAAGTNEVLADGRFEAFEEDLGFDDGFDDEFGVYGFAVVEGLAVGSYQVQLLEGSDVLQTSEAAVLTCLAVTAVCNDVTLTNPTTNPAVFGLYLDGDEESAEEVLLDFELEPGQTRTDTLDASGDLAFVLALDAAALELDEEDLDLRFEFAAYQEVELGQGCEPPAIPEEDESAAPVADPADPAGADPSTSAPNPSAPNPSAPHPSVPDQVAAPPLTHPATSSPLADTGGPAVGLAALGLLSLTGGLALLAGRRRARA